MPKNRENMEYEAQNDKILDIPVLALSSQKMESAFPPLKNDLMLRAARGIPSSAHLASLVDTGKQERKPSAHLSGSCVKLDDTCQVFFYIQSNY